MQIKHRLTCFVLLLGFISLCSCDSESLVSPARGTFHREVYDGNIEKVKAMLERDPRLIRAEDQNFRKPLNVASYAGNPDMVRFLLAEGARVHEPDIKIAAERGHREVAEILISEMAGGECDHWLLPYAAMIDSKKMTELLLSRGATIDYRSLDMAAEYGSNEVMELLIANGADVNKGDIKTSRPLGYALRNLKLRTAFILYNHGGRLSASDVGSLFPLSTLFLILLCSAIYALYFITKRIIRLKKNCL